jgi:hypothetical protein
MQVFVADRPSGHVLTPGAAGAIAHYQYLGHLAPQEYVMQMQQNKRP